MKPARGLAVLAFGWLAACGSHARHVSGGPLPEGALARVGDEVVDARTIRRIAEAQGTTLRVACEEAVFDALFARYAREHFAPALVSQTSRNVAARALLEDFARRSRELGPPTDAEVGATTQRHFWELDRPPMLRTTHAVVLVKNPGDDARARSLAERVATAVAGARDPVTFREKATTVPAGDLTVRVEDLDPVARDGRAVNPSAPPPPGSTPAHFSTAYVEAAYSIPEVGGQSPVVKTEFGYHVILAVERLPEQRVSLEERRRILEAEILADRAEKMREETLSAARAARPVEIERSAMELTEKVGPAP